MERSRSSKSSSKRSISKRSSLKRSSQRSSSKRSSSKRSSQRSSQRSSIKQHINECPKTPFHQPTIERNSSLWLKINSKKDLIKKKENFFIKNKNISTGIYLLIILKENPDIIFLLKEYNDLSMNDYQEYELPQDAEWPTYGHSSIYSNEEYKIEWMKETTARDFESKAKKEKNKKKKHTLLKKANHARSQCFLVYAGQLYYDKKQGIIMWTNHSGHFQPKSENRYLVGFPDNLFVPAGSKKIDERLEEYFDS